MITEKCTLPIGVEYEGKIHRDLEIRPRLVRDMIDGATGERAQNESYYYSLCQTACQIIRLGDIPREKITGDLLLDMYEDDFDVLTEAAHRVRVRTREFRGGQEGYPKTDPGAPETGVPSPRDTGHDGGGDGGLDRGIR